MEDWRGDAQGREEGRTAETRGKEHATGGRHGKDGFAPARKFSMKGGAMEEKKGKWTRGKVLAVVLPLCAVVIGLAAALVLILTGGESGETSKPEEKLVQDYEKVKEEADAALDEMEDLQSEEVVSDPEAYEQELQEALQAFESLMEDLDEAAEAAVEVAEEYEELYSYIYEYYDYLYRLTEEAVDQIEYLLSLAPSLQQMEQVDELLKRMENLPRGSQWDQLLKQVSTRSQNALEELENLQAQAAPGGAGMEELSQLTQQADAVLEQLVSSAQEGQAGLKSLADQLASTLAEIEQQAASAVSSAVSAFSSTLSQMEQAIQSLIP